ncbi:hypothetical protein GQ602_005350 [Ophiocordyceps camponoti-floridani]|uniref:Uncharacterized protein n=1 Tax=Ophiocordyceps camponoti-floridani TaxID=2030778 RepID=A0A8H4Q605_9HYPO|nr:hypothetical protein GQ602_005350 [Ophiocordyceps camponoti-floridani]
MKFAHFMAFSFAGIAISAPIAKKKEEIPWRVPPTHKPRGSYDLDLAPEPKPNFDSFVKELLKNHVGEVQKKGKVSPLHAIGAQFQGAFEKLFKETGFPRKFDVFNAEHWYQIGGPEFLKRVDLSGIKEEFEKNGLYQVLTAYIKFIRSQRRKGDIIVIKDLPKPFPEKSGRE